MPNWTEAYRSKCVTAEKAVEIIRSNYRVFLSANCSVPQTLLKALVQRAPELSNVEICQVLALAPDRLRRARDGRPSARQLAVHQRQRARSGQRRPRRLHPLFPERGARALHQRPAAGGRGSDPRGAAR